MSLFICIAAPVKTLSSHAIQYLIQADVAYGASKEGEEGVCH